MQLDQEACYRALKGRDRRFDGVFYAGVRTTGIYCRPSCPAITPKRGNVDFYVSAAAAQAQGFRACRRCRPDATPGSPEWDLEADAAARAMRLIADGVVERDGVDGLARRLGYSVRQLHRIVHGAYGAGPLSLARSRRAQTARILVETTDLPFAEVAYAAGFASIRQFNETVREVYAATPTELRGRRGQTAAAGVIRTRIAVREPFDAAALLHFLDLHAAPGVEAVVGDRYERTLRLPRGHGVVRVALGERRQGAVECELVLADARDLAPALERTRRLLDADADPGAVATALAEDPLLAPAIDRAPGLRVPGSVDGDETAVRAVLGQQISLAAARTATRRLAEEHGEPLRLDGDHAVDRVFPSSATLAGVPEERLRLPRSRARALVGLARALADGDVVLDRSAERSETRARLLDLPGIGPWTADYVAMRALGDPDSFLPTDLGVRRGAAALGLADDATLAERSQRWRPWRSYALMHLWAEYLRDRSETTKET